MTRDKDEIYKQRLSAIPKFAFNGKVVDVFDDMIERSVPQYREVQLLSAKLATECYQPSSKIYDLGCSTGATILELSKLQNREFHIIGIDSSTEMITRCKTKVQSLSSLDRHKIELRCENLENSHISQASLVLCNYTLQFICPTKRKNILQTIYNGLLPGGVLLLSEKNFT